MGRESQRAHTYKVPEQKTEPLTTPIAKFSTSVPQLTDF